MHRVRCAPRHCLSSEYHRCPHSPTPCDLTDQQKTALYALWALESAIPDLMRMAVSSVYNPTCSVVAGAGELDMIPSGCWNKNIDDT